MVWAGHHVCWTNQSGIHYIDFNWSYCHMSRSSCLLDNPVTHTLHWLLLGILWYEQVITSVGQSSQAYMCSTLTFTTPLARLIPLLIWKMSFFILIQTTHSHKIVFFPLHLVLKVWEFLELKRAYFFTLHHVTQCLKDSFGGLFFQSCLALQRSSNLVRHFPDWLFTMPDSQNY